jgi:ankyrin repeat protein
MSSRLFSRMRTGCVYYLDFALERWLFFTDLHRFLWVHLVLQTILEDCDSPHEVKIAIKDLPSDLEAVYSRCLTRKRGNRRSSDIRLLTWVCAAPKPLNVDALRELLAMDLETGQVSVDKMPAEELMLQSGVGLVTLDIAERLVLPVHSTVRKFVFPGVVCDRFHSKSTSAVSNERWPLNIEAKRWSEATFRSALGSLCLFHIEQKTTLDLAMSVKPTIMRVPQPDIPRFLRQLIPTRFDLSAVDVSIKTLPFRINSNPISVNNFLRYALDNWLICNKELASDKDQLPWLQGTSDLGSRSTTEMFEKIATERNESFGVHPWPSILGSFNSHMSNMFAFAVANGHLPLLKVIKSDARVHAEVFNLPLAQHGQMLAVHVAAKKGLVSVLSELADICTLNAVCHSTGKNAMHFAAEAGSVGCLDVLLRDRRFDLDARDKEGRTALFLAAFAGHDEVVNVLQGTSRKVNVDAKDQDGLTPLWWASAHGHHKVVEALLETGKAKIEVQDKTGRSPLSQAAEHGHEKVARLLVGTGKAKVDIKDKNGLTPLLHAAKNGHCKTAEALLWIGRAGVETRDSEHCTPLLRAAIMGHDRVVGLLLKMGKAEVDATDLEGWNALFHAADAGHAKVVEVLLVTGNAEVDAKDRCGVTPLWRAVEEGHFGVVEVLLETGKADLYVVDYADTDMLLLAVKKGHYRIEQRLREAMEEKGDFPGPQLAS